jgi:hypothetical protein
MRLLDVFGNGHRRRLLESEPVPSHRLERQPTEPTEPTKSIDRRERDNLAKWRIQYEASKALVRNMPSAASPVTSPRQLVAPVPQRTTVALQPTYQIAPGSALGELEPMIPAQLTPPSARPHAGRHRRPADTPKPAILTVPVALPWSVPDVA